MDESRTALVAGATGLIGSLVIERLLADGTWRRVVALVRRPSERRRDGVEERVVDFERLAETGALGAADDVFCCLGTTLKQAGSREALRRVDSGYVAALARAARAEGAEQFLLVSSVGAGPDVGNFYLRVKAEAEAAVTAAGYRSTHVFRPSLLRGERREVRIGERLGAVAALFLDPFLGVVPALRPYRSVAAEDVAAAMVAAARRREPGRHVYTYAEIERLAGETKERTGR